MAAKDTEKWPCQRQSRCDLKLEMEPLSSGTWLWSLSSGTPCLSGFVNCPPNPGEGHSVCREAARPFLQGLRCPETQTSPDEPAVLCTALDDRQVSGVTGLAGCELGGCAGGAVAADRQEAAALGTGGLSVQGRQRDGRTFRGVPGTAEASNCCSVVNLESSSDSGSVHTKARGRGLLLRKFLSSSQTGRTDARSVPVILICHQDKPIPCRLQFPAHVSGPLLSPFPGSRVNSHFSFCTNRCKK